MLYGNNLADLAVVAPKVHAFIREHDLSTLACGRYDLGDDEFANVTECTTRLREDARYETHVRYLDVQVVVSGAEVCEVVPASLAREEVPYDETADIAFQSNEAKGARFVLEPGAFLLLAPADAHMPTLAAGKPAPEKKAVFKLRVRP